MIIHQTHLSFVQRSDDGAVVILGLAYDRLGELNLCCDVIHRYGVVVVIGDVQGVLGGRNVVKVTNYSYSEILQKHAAFGHKTGLECCTF